MLAEVRQPALDGALAQGAVGGLAVVGTLDPLGQVRAELAITRQADQGQDGPLLAHHLAHALDLTDDRHPRAHDVALIIGKA